MHKYCMVNCVKCFMISAEWTTGATQQVERTTRTEDEWIEKNNTGAFTYWSLEMNKTAADIHSERNKGAV